MEMDKNTEKTLDMVHKLLDGKHVFEGWYSLPYASSDDEAVDYKIEYKVKKVSLWKTKGEEICLYEGTIYIEPIQISLGVNDEWEYGFKQHDIYEYIWDELGETVTEKVVTILPHVCLDYGWDYKKLNSTKS
jgi:hypothetical protein